MPVDYGYNVVAFRTAFIVGVEILRLNGELRNCALSYPSPLSHGYMYIYIYTERSSDTVSGLELSLCTRYVFVIFSVSFFL